MTVTRSGTTTATCKPPPLGVKVKPKRIKAGKRARLTITVRPAVRGAVVRVGGRRARTNTKGVARLRVRFAEPHKVAVSVRSGTRRGTAPLRVTR